MATVLFVGLDNSLTLNAKHAVFQDPSGTTVTAALPVNHEIYFNVNDTNKLLRRLQHDDFDNIIVSSMSNRTEYQVSTEASPVLEHPDPPISQHDATKPSELKPTDPTELPEVPQLFQLPQEATFDEIDSDYEMKIVEIDSDEEHELSLNEATDFESFIQHLSRFKNEGKVELYHVFNFNSHHHIMSEIYQIFIQNVSLCIMVTESSEHFQTEEIKILQNNLSFSLQGLVIENCGEGGNIGNRDAETSALHQFSNFLVKNDQKGFLFPMKCGNLENTDRDTILSHALSSSFTTFPFSWYLFGFRLVQIMDRKHIASVSKDGMKISSELNMDRPATEAALEHLMERNIIIYFRDILNDTIFLDLHIFSSIFSALYEKSVMGTITQPNFDFAVGSSTKHVSSSDFSTLFLKLMIMAPYNSGEYIVPSLLAPLKEATVENILKEYDLYPVYFKCPSLGYEFITMLIAFLLNLPGGNWQILKDNVGYPVCLRKNCVKFQYGKNTVVVSYFSGVIEVNMRLQDQSRSKFSDVSATILHGLEKIRLILNSYHSFTFNMSFPCNCGKTDHKHSAIWNNESGLLKCENNEGISSDPTSATTRWINISGKSFCRYRFKTN